jgi:hypothetical protein
VREATYYVQFATPDEPGRWHTIARLDHRGLANEMARLAGTSYLRTTVTPATYYHGRVVSRSALRRGGALQHADWELGIGHFRSYGEGLLAKAERNLGLTSPTA